jgi:hypothetical protein
VETTTPEAPPPPPLPPPAPAPTVVRRSAKPGQLTPLWRVATVATWVMVFLAWSAVWKASRELGVATWWLGPDGDPQPIVVMLAPFAVPLVIVVLALNNVRALPWFGLAGAAALAVIGIVDLSYVRRLGVVELVIAGAGAAVAVASLAGTWRRLPVTAEVAAAPTADEPLAPPVERELEGDGPNPDAPR